MHAVPNNGPQAKTKQVSATSANPNHIQTASAKSEAGFRTEEDCIATGPQSLAQSQPNTQYLLCLLPGKSEQNQSVGFLMVSFLVEFNFFALCYHNFPFLLNNQCLVETTLV